MQEVIFICALIGFLITIFTCYKFVYAFIGLFGTRKFKQTDRKHTYGICISARNEEKVITNLLESIRNQDYPLKNLRVFIIAHNCTDNTAQLVREYADNHKDLNISLYEYNNPDERTKGYALRYLFNKIKEDFTIEAFDGYYIFDADNVLNYDYVTRMNEAFDSGEKIVTSFRNSKNFHQNWISFSYAVNWIKNCLCEHRAKSLLYGACRINGTGFLFANELVKDGWKFLSLTEDRAFCADAVIKGYRISYCEKAEFFDEQPYKLKVAWTQRMRWAKGLLLSAVESCPKLLKNMACMDERFPASYDHFWINFPIDVEAFYRSILSYSMQIASAVICGGGSLTDFLSYRQDYALAWGNG